MFKNKKAVIFDMDGTLIDSVGLWNEIDQVLIEQLGRVRIDLDVIQKQRDTKLREYAQAENPYLEYGRFLAGRYGSEQSAEEVIQLRYEISEAYLRERVDYKPGVPVFLKRLQEAGIRLAIASTTKRNNMDVYRLANRNIRTKAPIDETFALVLTREDASEMKPHPEIYERAMKQLGVTPEECLIFEDSLIGMEAAHRSGAETVAIWDAYSEKERAAIRALADHNFANYAEALEVLEKELQEIL